MDSILLRLARVIPLLILLWSLVAKALDRRQSVGPAKRGPRIVKEGARLLERILTGQYPERRHRS